MTVLGISNLKKILFSLFISVAFCQQTFAWDNSGHRLIAEIAFQHLNKHAKREVLYLTKKLREDYPYVQQFRDLATWPDRIKASGLGAFNSWHFINYPYYDRSYRGMKAKFNPDNALWAIKQGQTIINNPKVNANERARFLAFLVHIVGDVHQPLHCINRYSRAFPEGDGGGNAYPIKTKRADNLHAYWDHGLGLWYKKPLTKIARQIQQAYPMKKLNKQSKNLDSKAWSEESYQLAREFAYKIPENSKPTKAYQSKGQQIVEKRIALAGYRLANLLNSIWR